MKLPVWDLLLGSSDWFTLRKHSDFSDFQMKTRWIWIAFFCIIVWLGFFSLCLVLRSELLGRCFFTANLKRAVNHLNFNMLLSRTCSLRVVLIQKPFISNTEKICNENESVWQYCNIKKKKVIFENLLFPICIFIYKWLCAYVFICLCILIWQPTEGTKSASHPITGEIQVNI